jgi:DNA-binding CsgD family transcriptional regulator
MAFGRRSSALLGRRVECDSLDRQLAIIRSGHSSVLVLRGEPGIGKTALLEYVAERASGCRVARAAGVQSEMELAFAGLHQLCASSLDRIDRLADPQRAALATAFGLSSGAAPNPFLVGLATLSLFTEVAEEEPLVCVVDDAQWLDRASRQALGFVGRRLFAEPIALTFTTREQTEDFARLPELVVEGLDDVEARLLLSSVIRGPLDEMVRDRIVAETRGNPLALLELPRGLTPGELAGGFGLPDAPALSGRIEESFARRVEALAADPRRLLLVAAAEPVGNPVLVWRAAELLGIGAESEAPAAKSGLLEFGASLRFCHPLARSAVYRAASPEDRRSAHGALAEVTDPAKDPDRRAWHRAQATAGPSEEVASELEHSAGRARGRGGLAAAAAFLERATELTPDPARRAERALAAAYAKHEAGAHVAARELLGAAKSGPLDELQRARAQVLDGQIAFALSRGSDAAPLLLDAAKQLELFDTALARETYAEAFAAAMYAGRLAKSVGVVEVAEAARAAKRVAPSPQPARAQDLLLDGQALLITEPPRAATPMLKRALSAFRGDSVSNEDALRWLWLACTAAIQLWDDESWYVLSDRHVQLARDAGALTVLPLALNYCAGSRVSAGEFAAAEALGEEAQGVSLAIANPDVSISSLFLGGWRGRQAEALELIQASDRDAAARGEGRRIGAAHYATAVLYNGLGRHQLALTAARRALEYPLELATSRWALAEQIEAAARSGQHDPGALALQQLSETTRPSGTNWALGIEARSRALMSEGEVADGLYREAIDRLRRTRVRSELARAHLLYGEWLRRENRRLDARGQLRTAHETLTAMGAEAFADRAARELLATGETVRKRTSDTAGQLTAQEAQIARMARDGASNRQIAAQLFISHKTVEYHLRKVFAKLGISSRADLAAVLAPD